MIPFRTYRQTDIQTLQTERSRGLGGPPFKSEIENLYLHGLLMNENLVSTFIPIIILLRAHSGFVIALT